MPPLHASKHQKTLSISDSVSSSLHICAEWCRTLTLGSCCTTLLKAVVGRLVSPASSCSILLLCFLRCLWSAITVFLKLASLLVMSLVYLGLMEMVFLLWSTLCFMPRAFKTYFTSAVCSPSDIRSELSAGQSCNSPETAGEVV